MEKKKITDYKPLERNPNRGTQLGAGSIEQSVSKLGAGRSLLVDKNRVILGGNHAQEAFINAGIENVIEVPTDGKTVVVVRRTDLDANTAEGKEMVIMDNRTNELNLDWDALTSDELLREIELDKGELDRFLKDFDYQLNPREIDFQKEWQGMPSYENKDMTAYRTIYIHFLTEEDVEDFAKLLGREITDKTKYLWYLKQEQHDDNSERYIEA